MYGGKGIWGTLGPSLGRYLGSSTAARAGHVGNAIPEQLSWVEKTLLVTTSAVPMRDSKGISVPTCPICADAYVQSLQGLGL